MPENIAHVVIKDILASPRFSMLKDGKISGMVPVSVLPNKIAKVLINDSPNRAKETMSDSFSTIFFSNSTAKKQREGHADLAIEDYLSLQRIFENTKFIREKRNHVTFAGTDQSGKPFKAVIKRSSRGEYFLQTLHRVKEEQIQSIFKRKK